MRYEDIVKSVQELIKLYKAGEDGRNSDRAKELCELLAKEKWNDVSKATLKARMTSGVLPKNLITTITAAIEAARQQTNDTPPQPNPKKADNKRDKSSLSNGQQTVLASLAEYASAMGIDLTTITRENYNDTVKNLETEQEKAITRDLHDYLTGKTDNYSDRVADYLEAAGLSPSKQRYHWTKTLSILRSEFAARPQNKEERINRDRLMKMALKAYKSSIIKSTSNPKVPEPRVADRTESLLEQMAKVGRSDYKKRLENNKGRALPKDQFLADLKKNTRSNSDFIPLTNKIATNHVQKMLEQLEPQAQDKYINSLRKNDLEAYIPEGYTPHKNERDTTLQDNAFRPTAIQKKACEIAGLNWKDYQNADSLISALQGPGYIIDGKNIIDLNTNGDAPRGKPQEQEDQQQNGANPHKKGDRTMADTNTQDTTENKDIEPTFEELKDKTIEISREKTQYGDGHIIFEAKDSEGNTTFKFNGDIKDYYKMSGAYSANKGDEWFDNNGKDNQPLPDEDRKFIAKEVDKFLIKEALQDLEYLKEMEDSGKIVQRVANENAMMFRKGEHCTDEEFNQYRKIKSRAAYGRKFLEEEKQNHPELVEEIRKELEAKKKAKEAENNKENDTNDINFNVLDETQQPTNEESHEQPTPAPVAETTNDDWIARKAAYYKGLSDNNQINNYERDETVQDGFAASFNEAKIHYSSPNNVAVSKEAGLNVFDAMLKEPDNQGRRVNFSPDMPPEMAARLYAACLINGNDMGGNVPQLTEEQLKAALGDEEYAVFQQKMAERQAERQGTERTADQPAPEAPTQETPTQETPTQEGSSQEPPVTEKKTGPEPTLDTLKDKNIEISRDKNSSTQIDLVAKDENGNITFEFHGELKDFYQTKGEYSAKSGEEFFDNKGGEKQPLPEDDRKFIAEKINDFMLKEALMDQYKMAQMEASGKIVLGKTDKGDNAATRLIKGPNCTEEEYQEYREMKARAAYGKSFLAKEFEKNPEKVREIAGNIIRDIASGKTADMSVADVREAQIKALREKMSQNKTDNGNSDSLMDHDKKILALSGRLPEGEKAYVTKGGEKQEVKALEGDAKTKFETRNKDAIDRALKNYQSRGNR